MLPSSLLSIDKCSPDNGGLDVQYIINDSSHQLWLLQHIILFNATNDNIVRLAMLNDGWFQFREEIMQDINTLLLRFGSIFFTIDLPFLVKSTTVLEAVLKTILVVGSPTP